MLIFFRRLFNVANEKTLTLDQSVNFLRAAGESTRLRLLSLLSESDLTVSDLIEILGQSQPRISRHLKLLTEAGLLERYQEGAWAYFRLRDQGPASGLVQSIISQFDSQDKDIERDRERLQMVRNKRAEQASEYFSNNAAEWDKIRSLHIDETNVESAMLEMVGESKIDSMLDLGTGTGRMLELFSGIYEKGIGIDASRDMLSIARSRLDEANLSRVQTRQGDLFLLPTQPASFNLVTIHQVLHYLDNPARAITEAAKALAPQGRLLIADFAPHELEFLQEEHAHIRMGFPEEQMAEWLEDAGLKLRQVKHLEPKDKKAKDALTVSLWLAEK
jgi:ArsR family transcriptional regulator